MCIHNCLESNTGEFGIVYKAQLTHWHGEGLPRAVAVKTLKGKMSAIMNMLGICRYHWNIFRIYRYRIVYAGIHDES